MAINDNRDWSFFRRVPYGLRSANDCWAKFGPLIWVFAAAIAIAIAGPVIGHQTPLETTFAPAPACIVTLPRNSTVAYLGGKKDFRMR